MRHALLTDIHANREALSAVLDDVRALGCDRIAVLGDVVGYGPDPVWCAERVAALVADEGAICLRGNHDAALAGGDPAMNPVARIAIDWTRARLRSDQIAWLAARPMTALAGEATLVHASPESPGDWIYVTNAARARGGLAVAKTRLVFCGHVHVPALYSRDIAGRVAAQEVVTGHPVPLLRTRRWLAVIGAAGQPRDGVPQAGWALYDDARAELTFRRVPYDSAATAAKIRAAGLPDALARRLLTGA